MADYLNILKPLCQLNSILQYRKVHALEITMTNYLKYSNGNISPSGRENEQAKVVLISRSTPLAYQDDSMATLPINPASFNRAGGRQTSFLEYLLFLGVAWRLFLAGGGPLAFLEKEDGRGKRYREITRKNATGHDFQLFMNKRLEKPTLGCLFEPLIR